MSIGNRHLPDADVREDRGEELAECKWNNQLEVVIPGDVYVLTHTHHIKQRPTVYGD